ncbi:MAG: DUF1344 domain-containing protein [Pseudomonadota bacterium]
MKNYGGKAMTLSLDDGSTYTLPKTFKDPGLKAGEKVNVPWEQKGSSRLADTVTITK